MSDKEMQHYAAVLSYDGSAYFGWQRLRDKPSIQGAVEDALSRCFGESVGVRGAGRTDRGAHARGQVAGFAIAGGPESDALLESLNRELESDIRAKAVHKVAADFHVRTSAIEKTYDYRIDNRAAELDSEPAVTDAWRLRDTLDVAAMRVAARHLVGHHDFASFATKPRFKQKSTAREIRALTIEARDGYLLLKFTADSFLNHMVRNMVCALARVGDGRYSPAKLADILAAKNRAASPGSAPACGLTLVDVRYEPPLGSI